MTPATLARDTAIAQVSKGVSPEWLDNACSLIRLVALNGQPFTADAVRHRISDPAEPRAWGAAFQRCAREGHIKPTGNWKQSESPTCHARPMREWVAA